MSAGWQDKVNAAFELVAVVVVLASARKVVRLRASGESVSFAHVGYSVASAVWFAYYYAHLAQWWSFGVGLFYFAAVALWAGLLIFYWRGAGVHHGD